MVATPAKAKMNGWEDGNRECLMLDARGACTMRALKVDTLMAQGGLLGCPPSQRLEVKGAGIPGCVDEKKGGVGANIFAENEGASVRTANRKKLAKSREPFRRRAKNAPNSPRRSRDLLEASSLLSPNTVLNRFSVALCKEVSERLAREANKSLKPWLKRQAC